LTDEWFVFLLLYCLPLLFKVWQMSGSCCCCYIVYHYSLRFDRWVIRVFVVILSIVSVLGLTEGGSCCYIVYDYSLIVWQMSGSCCCYIVYHYCFRFDRGVVRVVVILSIITVLGYAKECFVLLLYCLS
jgi:hypothetical protein